MSRRSVFILVLAAVLLAGFCVALSRRDSRDWRATRTRRLMPFPWQDAASVTIRRSSGEVRFTREPGEEWQVLLPDGKADILNPGAVDALAALATLAWRDPLPDGEPPVPGDVTLEAHSHSGRSVTLAFGRLVNNVRTATIDGDNDVVYQVNQDLLGFLDWPERRFRKLYLASVAGGIRPRRVRLEPSPSDPGVTLDLQRAPGGWRLTHPVDWPADPARLEQLFLWLDRLRATSVVAETVEDPARFGLDRPSARVEAWYDTPSGPLHRRVEFGSDAGDGQVYARVTGRSPLFTVPAQIMADLVPATVRDNPVAWLHHFRRRTGDLLLGRPTAAVSSVTIERLLPTPSRLIAEKSAGGDWYGTLVDGERVRRFRVDAPDPELPDRPLAALLNGLAHLRIRAFLADDAPGPDTLRWTAYPAWRIAVQFADGSSAPELTLYAEDATGALPPGMPYREGSAEAQSLGAPGERRGGPGIAFSVTHREAVVEADAGVGRFLCLPPYRYQSATLQDRSIADWRRVDRFIDGTKETFIRPPGEVNEQWWRQDTPSVPLMDDNSRFVGMLLSLSQLRSDGFVSDGDGDIAEFGLDRPEITAIVYSSPERGGGEVAPLFELALGDTADSRGRRYARLNGEGPVFLLPAAVGNALGERYE